MLDLPRDENYGTGAGPIEFARLQAGLLIPNSNPRASSFNATLSGIAGTVFACLGSGGATPERALFIIGARLLE